MKRNFRFDIDNEIDEEIEDELENEMDSYDDDEEDGYHSSFAVDQDDEEDDYDFHSYGNHRSHRNLAMGNMGTKVTIAVSLLLLLILFLILYYNPIKKEDKQTVSNNSYDQVIADMESQHQAQAQSEQSVDDLLTGSTLTASDLDIWDMDEELDELHSNQQEKENSGESSEESNSDNNGQSNAATNDSEENADPATDGQHTLIQYEDGTEEWVDINPYLDRNTYNYSNLVYQNPIMKYYENNNKISFVGADISKVQDYVDFNALKKAGVDFVMIRLGQSGYQTGEITLDEYFEDNMKRAADAGLDIGIYFFSEATTTEEVQAEAQFVIEHLEGYDITYPVVYYTGAISHETGRADSLEKMPRTNIAITFMDAIREAGYMPMLRGTKEWLIKKYSLGSMMDYSVWLDQPQDVPDYPYEFTIWQYTNTASISGISGGASLCISFVDYSLR